MKKLHKLLFIFVVIFVLTACNKDATYELSINENIATEIYLGEDEIDYKSFFIIKDQDGNLITVEDSMIDSSNVDLSKKGTYKIKLNYKGLEKEVVITVNEKSSNSYTITINNEIDTDIYMSNTDIDFKKFFKIKDSNGNIIEVLDPMIDASSIDFTKEGTYILKITYQNVSKEISINIIPDEKEITYEIKINNDLSTTIEIWTEDIDFKKYFTIIDSNGNNIEVLDSMIDKTNVSFSRIGKFTLQLKFNDLIKELEFNIIAAEKMNATDLFISEYAEGKNYDKYIEIFNGTGKTIDLSNYSIMLLNNSAQPAQYSLDLTGTLKDGEILVIYNPSAGAIIKNSGDIANQVISYNGNDVIALYNDDILIDVVGDLFNPVSVGWDIDGTLEATKDHTLIRKGSVYGPNSNWTPSEWIVLVNEDFSNIKKHTMVNYEPIKEDDGGTPKERVKDIFISEYFEGGQLYKDSKYIEIYNPLGIDVDLGDYSLALYKNGALEPSFIQPLTGILNKNEVYIVYAPYSVDEIKKIGDLSSEVCYFNGKAAIAILKNNEVIDVIGVIGEYPEGDGWYVDDYSTTANNTIIRKESIDSPIDKWDLNEWYPCYENYLYGIDNHYQVDQENLVYENFDYIFNMMKELELDSKGTATSEKQIKVKGTVFMDVKSETTLVYLTDGRNFIKLHGEKIHNYTSPGTTYEIICNYKAYLYQPTLEVLNPSSDIKILVDATPITEIEVKEVSLSEVLALKKEDFALNISNGYLQSMLKIKGFLQLDTHNSTKYDYCLTVNEVYTKNNTGYINNGLYFKNDVEELEEYLIDYEVSRDVENMQIDIYGVIYDWNPNRKNWRIYVSNDLTIDNLVL